jgi:hypothetical protein
MKKEILALAILAMFNSAFAENKDKINILDTVSVTAIGYTNYQVQRLERPDVFNKSVHIQETAPGLRNPYLGAFTGNQVTQTIDGIRFNNPLFRTGPNQYFSWIPDSFVEEVAVSDGGNVGGTINRRLGIAPTHIGGSYNSALGLTETASYKGERFGFALSNIDFDNVRTADGIVPNSAYNQKAGMFEARWNNDHKTTMIISQSDDLRRTDRWNGGMRLTGFQSPSVYTWDLQQYTLLKHDAQFDKLKIGTAYQQFKENITDGTKPISSLVDSYTLNGEYFFDSGFSLYSTNSLEKIKYDNGVAVSSTNPIRVNNDIWGTYKQGVRWYGDVASLDVIASVGYKTVKAGDSDFNNLEGSLIVGKNGYFASYDRSTNTPNYFQTNQSLTSGRGITIPNNNLKEEFADTYRAGFNKNGLYFDVYYKKMENAVQLKVITTNPLVNQPYNGGFTDVYGSTVSYKNNSIMDSKFGIDTRLIYTYGTNNLPDGTTEGTVKTIPLFGYTRINYDKVWTEFQFQTRQNRLAYQDLVDTRVYNHNNGYEIVNIGYTDNIDKFNYTVALMNAFNSNGRVLGSSADVPARALFVSARYNF